MKTDSENIHYSKLMKVGNIIIGTAGGCDEAGLMFIFADKVYDNEKLYTPGRRIQEFDVLNFLFDFVAWKVEKTKQPPEIENDYLLGFKDGSIFYTNSWFVTKVLSYQVIGAGTDYAIAALSLGYSVERAVEVAIQHSVWCMGPVKSFDSSDWNNDENISK